MVPSILLNLAITTCFESCTFVYSLRLSIETRGFQRVPRPRRLGGQWEKPQVRRGRLLPDVYPCPPIGPHGEREVWRSIRSESESI